MIQFFVNRYTAVFCFCLLIIIIGVMAYVTLPRESMPEIKQPIIFISTIYPGVAAKDIENLITRPIEEEIDGLEGLTGFNSSSQQSLSFISVEFATNISAEIALRRVKQSVDLAKVKLPADAEEPVVQELSSSNWPIFIAVLSHPDGISVIDEAAKNLRDRLKGLKGALDADIAGNLEKEIAIQVYPAKLEHYGFSLDDIIFELRNENMSIPGGLLKNPVKNYTLDVTGEIKDPALFEDIIISGGGVKVRLGELARVTFNWKEPETYSRINGVPGINISLKKRTGENIVYLVNQAQKVVDELKETFPKGTLVDVAYDESEYIRDMISDLENNMFTGLLFVILVTIFFLGARNSFFVSLAIPFSMLASFFILQFLGITLNMIVLFSLIMALGMLVDNGIVIVENIYRHANMGKGRYAAAIDGSTEVAGPIITSTLTTCLAFAPIIFMPGLMGDIMSYLPKTVIIVLTCSLIVALTINPVFCSRFMKISEKSKKKMEKGSGAFITFQRFYEKIITWATDHSGITTALVIFIVVLGIILYSLIGKESIFFPNLDPSTTIINIEAPPGTPLDVTDELIKRIEDKIPGVPASLRNYQTITGRGNSDFFGGGIEYHKGNVRVEFKSYFERKIKGKESAIGYKKALENFTGADVTIDTLDFGPPTGAPLSYEVIGDDFEVMSQIALKMMDIFKEYDELSIINSDYESARPEISVEINREKAAFFGLSTVQIASTIRNAIGGAIVGSFRDLESEYDIVVRYAEQYRNTIDNLMNLQVIGSGEKRIPLSSVVDITQKSSIGVIKRRNLLRAIGVWAEFREGVQNKEEVSREIAGKIETLNAALPDGYTIQLGEGFEYREESTNFLIQAFIIAIFLIFVVLIAQFNSIFEAFIIIFSVFLSIGGVFWGYVISGQTFVIIMSGIGCIALAGIVVNNCIVLVDYTNVLLKDGMDYKKAVIEAGKVRLRPVLLTAITTVLGLLPMALGISLNVHWPNIGIQMGSETSEFWKAFSLAMIFGLSFATIMTLVIVPAMLRIKYRFFPPKFHKK